MNDFRGRVIKDLIKNKIAVPQLTLEQENESLKGRVENLKKALTSVKNCPVSDLTKYCMSVDSIVCIALADDDCGRVTSND